MALKVTKSRSRYADFVKALDALAKGNVLVGVPRQGEGDGRAGPDERKPETPGGPPPVMNNATLAFIHNNGSAAANIPAREFMASGIKGGQPDIDKAIRVAGEKVAKLGGADPLETVDKALTVVGLVAQRSIRRRIDEGIPPPLKPRTIEGRLARGRTGVKPLVDTHQLLNSINFVNATRRKA